MPRESHCRWGLVAACLCGVFAPRAARADLLDYVRKADKAYAWEKRSAIKKPQGMVYDLHLVSQKWQGITWEHRLQVFEPQKVEFPGAVTLFITGGGGSDADTALGLTIANATGTLFAILYHIPNQPLFGGKSEDDLIAHTFEQYLESGDETWPLLFPMVKSAVRAMDALQAFAVQEKMPPLRRFIVSGASKRGWTTWLTAATGDSRVKGIVPIVYDNLNLPAQMPHQLEQWGRYSEQIEDYTRRGLQQKANTPRGSRMTQMVDPYAFRKSLTLPKLIINGTNDRYWAQDALNLYWDELRGPKWILYATNSGHGIENRLPVLAATTAFVRAVAADRPLPKLEWRYETLSPNVRLTVTAKPTAKEVRLWTAHSDTKDFRSAKWTAAPMQASGDGFAADIPAPESGYLAVFAETTHDLGGRPFPSSTQIHILSRRN